MNTLNYLAPHKICSEVFLFLLIVASSFCFSQNKTESTYDAKLITKVVVNGNEIFNTDVVETDGDFIKIESITDGEYQNDFRIVSELKANILYIALQASSIENLPDDKRNAHKVIAATLKIKMPSKKSLSIKSNVGSVNLNGNFNEINVELKQGDFIMEGVAKLAIIKTFDGNIYAKTKNTIIETDSHHGLVSIPNGSFGFNLWKLKTIGGNIKVETIN